MKKASIFISSVLLVTGCSINANIANANESNAVIDSGHSLKTKVDQNDPRDPNGQTGLLVYGYVNGASLQLSTPLNGVFKSSLRPIINEAGSKDLKEFSILFS